jgi:hypothetical protein
MKSHLYPPAKSKPPRGRFWGILLPALGIASVIFTLFLLFPVLLAEYWSRQLVDAAPGRIDELVHRIGNLDTQGIPILVEAISSDREVVAQAAKRQLLERLDQWKSLPEIDHSTRMLLLAERLAERTPNFGPAARSDAAELASQMILLIPASERFPNRTRLIAACDDVLHTVALIEGESPLPRPTRRTTSQADIPSAASMAYEPDNTRNNPAEHFDSLPGGGLPLELSPVEKPKNPQVLPGEDAELPPGYFQAPSKTRSLDFSNRSATTLRIVEPKNQAKPISEQESSESTPPVRSLSHQESKPERVADTEYRDWDTVKVMRQLGQSEGGELESLQVELRRRGFSPVEIELVSRLFDPDPTVRKKLVAELPAISDIDATSWLLQCCKDEDAEVRLAAFSLLATSNNTIMLQKLKNMAANDSDERILRIANQITDSARR